MELPFCGGCLSFPVGARQLHREVRGCTDGRRHVGGVSRDAGLVPGECTGALAGAALLADLAASRRASQVPPDQARNNTALPTDRKSTRLNSSHSQISYAVFCLKKKKSQR